MCNRLYAVCSENHIRLNYIGWHSIFLVPTLLRGNAYGALIVAGDNRSKNLFYPEIACSLTTLTVILIHISATPYLTD